VADWPGDTFRDVVVAIQVDPFFRMGLRQTLSTYLPWRILLLYTILFVKSNIAVMISTDPFYGLLSRTKSTTKAYLAIKEMAHTVAGTRRGAQI
jgi:type III secretory pathway component EscT